MALNFGGGIFSEEAGFLPTPTSSQDLKNFSTQNETTLYTCPAGKRFFITSCSIDGLSAGSNSDAIVKIKANSVVIASMNYTNDGSGNPAWTPVYQGFPAPVELTPTQTITTELAGIGTDQIIFQVAGWEE